MKYLRILALSLFCSIILIGNAGIQTYSFTCEGSELVTKKCTSVGKTMSCCEKTVTEKNCCKKQVKVYRAKFDASNRLQIAFHLFPIIQKSFDPFYKTLFEESKIAVSAPKIAPPPKILGKFIHILHAVFLI